MSCTSLCIVHGENEHRLGAVLEKFGSFTTQLSVFIAVFCFGRVKALSCQQLGCSFTHSQSLKDGAEGSFECKVNEYSSA